MSEGSRLMCGIAGYNCSPAWQAEFLDQKKQNKILEEAWLHNQHRGYDAAGYFAVHDKGIRVFKKAGTAAEILVDMAKKEKNVPISRVFGTHTRATTQGTEKDNRNNHPVFWDNIWVTHNGTIHNDDSFRRGLEKKEAKNLPAVDTVAINIALAGVNDPYDIDDVIDNLEDLSGGFAFHAIWKDHPGLSLLVRGDLSPLIVAYNAAGCIVYGSQKESVWHIIYTMGHDPADDNWVFRDMAVGQVMLFKDGTPIVWKSLPKTKKNLWSQRADFHMQRILPSEDDRECQVVYATNRLSDFALENEGHARSLGLAKKPQHLQVIYTRNGGFLNGSSLKTYPAMNDTAWQAVASEADTIYQNKKTKYLHVYYGNLEIVMNRSRAIQDIYNHDLFTDDDRWTKKLDKTEKEQVIISDDFEEFLILKSTSVNSLPTKPEDYAYVRAMNLKEATRATPQLPVMTGPITTVGRDTSKKPHYWKSITQLGWEDIFTKDEEVVFHNTAHDLMFLQVENNGGGTCSVHNVKFVEHSSPKGCTFLITAAAFAYSNIIDLDVLDYVLGDDASLVYTLPDHGDACDKKKGHYYLPSSWKRVRSEGVEFDIIVAEECSDCYISKEIAGLPFWLDKMFRPGVYKIAREARDELPNPFESVFD